MKLSGSRIKTMVKKEFRSLFRDWGSLGSMIFLPIFLLVMFGYAVSLDVKNIHVGVLDRDNSPESRRFVESFFRSDYFIKSLTAEREKDFDELLLENRVTLGIVVPRDFADRLHRGLPAEVQFLLDGSNSNTASAVTGYVQAIVQAYSLKETPGLPAAPLDLRPLIRYNPDLRSSVFLIPGLIAMILVVTAVIATALAIVREKELGTMEQIITSPILAPELILGKIIPPFIVSLAVTAFILVVSDLLFDVSIRGNFLDLGLVTLLFLFSCLGLGLFISTLADTQQSAFMIAIIVTFLPSYILSGFVFPIRNMPLPVQLVTYLNPSRYFLSALRHVMIRGTGIEYFWKELLSLLLFSLAVFGASIARLKKGRIG